MGGTSAVIVGKFFGLKGEKFLNVQRSTLNVQRSMRRQQVAALRCFPLSTKSALAASFSQLSTTL